MDKKRLLEMAENPTSFRASTTIVIVGVNGVHSQAVA